MEKPFSKFHFPVDIKLTSKPLAEAWLDIRWQLEHSSDVPGFMRDPGFPFALGAFYNSIKKKFRHREDLDTSNAPLDMLPYVVRHRFRPGEDEWPVLQLGPGVASVNYVGSYTWDDFRKLALYLRQNLLDAYSETELKTQAITLRYRNIEPFDYSSNNLFDFFKKNLNTSIQLPHYIPGSISSSAWPTSINMVSTFDLLEPKGKGTLRLGTGIKAAKESDEEKKEMVLIWELDVSSKADDVPKLNEEAEFADWLDSAHSVIHEWFFSLIEGPLYKKYKGEE
ncbi:MAG: TIGR04255 family protein [Anaerolineae bacterium]|nr:TIGR04255 family protein [Anaerolineae bacterium]